MAASSRKVLATYLLQCHLRSPLLLSGLHRGVQTNVMSLCTRVKPIPGKMIAVSRLPQCRYYATSSPASANKESKSINEYMAQEPVDDVFMLSHYPPTLYSVDEALQKLRRRLDASLDPKPNSSRTVLLNIALDMKLQKKKKVDPFQNVVMLPHRFRGERKVLCFAKKPEDIQTAKEAGADIVGGKELIEDIINGLITFEHCVATPDVMPDLQPLKKELRKKFPKSKRQSVSKNIPAMLNLFKNGQLYKCTTDTVDVPVGTLSQPNEHLEENIKAIVTAVAEHKSQKYWPFIKSIFLSAYQLGGYKITYQHWLPEVEEEAEVEVFSLPW
ncbi:large ribosomal subunit protein uL1m-like [Glandiceps talaboti]